MPFLVSDDSLRQVLGMDGKFDKLDELVYVEKMLSGTGSKFFGEVRSLLSDR